MGERAARDVFASCCSLIGQDGDPQGELEELLDVLARVPDPAGAELRQDGVATPPHGGRPIQFVDVFPWTPDGKVQLFSEQLDAESPAGLYGYQPDPATHAYPLALISPSSDRTITSTLSELPRPEVRLLMHPDDAVARAIEDGADVRIFNQLGEVRCRAQLGAWIRPGTVLLPGWAQTHRKRLHGYGARARHAEVPGGSACFNDAAYRSVVARTPSPRCSG